MDSYILVQQIQLSKFILNNKNVVGGLYHIQCRMQDNFKNHTISLNKIRVWTLMFLRELLNLEDLNLEI